MCDWHIGAENYRLCTEHSTALCSGQLAERVLYPVHMEGSHCRVLLS